MATEGSAGSSNKITMEDQTQKEPQAASTHASGPSVSDHCTTDQPISSAQASSGELSELGDVDVYITKPNDYPHSPSKLLLFLTNGTGIHSLNNQLQADNYAKEGFLVVMPDMFAGDPAPKSNTVEPTPDEEQSSIIEQFKLHAAETAKSFLLDMWLARHTPEKVMPRVQKVLESMKEEFADAVANGGGVYAVGYCFGGKYVLELGQETQNTINTDEEQGTVNTGPAIKVGAIAHGTLVTLEDVIGVKVPISMVCVENDQLFPDDVREEGRKTLEENHIEHEIKVYPRVPHGFAVLGEYEDEHIRSSQTKAYEQMLEWLKSH